VPDLDELRAGLGRARQRLGAGTARTLERDRARLRRSEERLAAAPRLLLERRRSALDRSAARLQALSPRATLARGYAIVRAGGAVVRDAGTVSTGGRVEIELEHGGLGARVEDVRP
jgi:exodeoxyribonuclease VII large subunit